MCLIERGTDMREGGLGEGGGNVCKSFLSTLKSFYTMSSDKKCWYEDKHPKAFSPLHLTGTVAMVFMVLHCSGCEALLLPDRQQMPV